jgi:hypothetical protein
MLARRRGMSPRRIFTRTGAHMAIITTGKYLKREEVSEDGSTHKVISVVSQMLSMGDGQSETKWVLTLSDLKPLILNATNIRRCVAAFGTSETDEWTGKSIVVYDDPSIEFGGKIVGGVRLRAVPKKATKTKAAPVVDDDESPVPF